MSECNILNVVVRFSSYWRKESAIEAAPQFHDGYRMGKEIGTGNFAIVNECFDVFSGKQCAVKIVDKQKLNRTEKRALEDEISILTQLNHPRIMKLFCRYEDFASVYLVTEYISGGDLFDRVYDKKKFTELESCRLCKNLLQAVTYIHDQSIVHRDIKPENILLSHKSNDTDVKLCDFGLATFVNGENRTTFCGSASYIASEIVRYKSYGTKVDLWSVGVNIFTLLSGKLPFVAENMKTLIRLIRRGHFEFNEVDWKHVSHDAKDFVSSLLQVDPSKRLSAEEALQNKWIQNVA